MRRCSHSRALSHSQLSIRAGCSVAVTPLGGAGLCPFTGAPWASLLLTCQPILSRITGLSLGERCQPPSLEDRAGGEPPLLLPPSTPDTVIKCERPRKQSVTPAIAELPGMPLVTLRGSDVHGLMQTLAPNLLSLQPQASSLPSLCLSFLLPQAGQ